jgi:hypothetical protein
MKFVAVYETETIRDPDKPEETLGNLTFEIAKLQATNVQARMTYCRILDPFVPKELDLFNPILTGKPLSESRVDPGTRKIGGPGKLKLKVGTVVIEAPQG